MRYVICCKMTELKNALFSAGHAMKQAAWISFLNEVSAAKCSMQGFTQAQRDRSINEFRHGRRNITSRN